MRLSSYERGARRSQRAFVRLTRALGAELDDVGKASVRRPTFFGKPFLGFAHSLLRGPSAWSVGERELFAAVVSRANSCQFCVGTHAEIAAKELGRDVLERMDEGRFSPRAAAAAAFVEALTRDPNSVSGVKIDVAGGSSRSMLFTAAFLTTGGAPVPGRGSIAAIVPSAP